MKSPVSKIVIGLSLCMSLLGGVVGYNHFFKPAPPAKEKVKKEKRKIKRTYKDGKIAYEEVQEFIESRWTAPKPKPYLLGATLGYDFHKVTYNIMAGKQVTKNCYAIGKSATDLSKIEVGALCVF